jgi:hypothetical protein
MAEAGDTDLSSLARRLNLTIPLARMIQQIEAEIAKRKKQVG